MSIEIEILPSPSVGIWENRGRAGLNQVLTTNVSITVIFMLGIIAARPRTQRTCAA